MDSTTDVEPLAIRRGLDPVEFGIRPAFGHQFVVRADFGDAGAVEDHNEVGLRTVEKRCDTRMVMRPSAPGLALRLPLAAAA